MRRSLKPRAVTKRHGQCWCVVDLWMKWVDFARARSCRWADTVRYTMLYIVHNRKQNGRKSMVYELHVNYSDSMLPYVRRRCSWNPDQTVAWWNEPLNLTSCKPHGITDDRQAPLRIYYADRAKPSLLTHNEYYRASTPCWIPSFSMRTRVTTVGTTGFSSVIIPIITKLWKHGIDYLTAMLGSRKACSH